ncbi:hypothetical protein P9112_006678 [Eukaryota sp. TZLM1-RC]
MSTQAAPPFKFNKKYLMVAFFVFSIAKMFYTPGSLTPYPNSIPQHRPIFPLGSKLQLELYASTLPLSKFNASHFTPVYSTKDLTLTSTISLNESLSLELPESVLTHNSTLHAYLFISSPSSSIKPYIIQGTFTKVLPLYTQEERTFLASGQADNVTVLSKERGLCFLPEINFGIIPSGRYYKWGKLPGQFQGKLNLTPSGRAYYPLTFFNDFWILPEHTTPINSLNESNIDFTFVLKNVPIWKYTLYSAIEQQTEIQQSLGLSELTGGPEMFDEFKRIFLTTSPYLLAVTGLVTLGHTISEMLAFKSDLQFWKGKKNLSGLSIRSVLFNTVMQTIILLYLVDSETSFVVIITSGIGLIIEYFKLFKCFDLVFIVKKGIKLPWLKAKSSYDSNTRKYDSKAMTFVMVCLLPIILGYSIWTYYNSSFKSTYSWIITTLVNISFAFSFAQMVPQVYINYKLKSVAHINYRTLSYKFFTTIIDDFSTFVLKLPLLYKIACFRDDVVFVILMVQRFIYPVDKKRIEGTAGIVDVKEHED